MLVACLVPSFLLFLLVALLTGVDEFLIGRWKLRGDCRDCSPNRNDGKCFGVSLTASGAEFDGLSGYIHIPNSKSLALGSKDFSVLVWIRTDTQSDDLTGDILSKYDPVARRGLSLGIMDNSGVVGSQANSRNLHFGIDGGGIDGDWTDCGRAGASIFSMALSVHDGSLYQGTCEHEAGHVYRYGGGRDWIHCGAPDRCNAVSALAVHDGRLYAGASLYRTTGSGLPASPNEHPGGAVYRYEGGRDWAFCGKLGDPETGEAASIGGLAVYNCSLYATSMYAEGRGLYRYEGGTQWKYLGSPGYRVVNPFVFHGDLYAASWDRAAVARYDGSGWTDISKGIPAEENQIYGFVAYGGKLHAGSWPLGTVYRYDGPGAWTSIGRLGNEKEVMGLMVYNGALYAGTLPGAFVFRHEAGTPWARIGRQLDTAPGIYRRAWSAAVYDGKLFFGTLPSGLVHSIEVGRNVTCDRRLAPGWRHLAAVREAGTLRLYVDGGPVARSRAFEPAGCDISNVQPLAIGFGPRDYFRGGMRDLRIFSRALSAEEVAADFANAGRG